MQGQTAAGAAHAWLDLHALVLSIWGICTSLITNKTPTLFDGRVFQGRWLPINHCWC